MDYCRRAITGVSFLSAFFAGVIEGFYGRQWTWSERHDHVGFLSSVGLQTYIYAPKGDAFLRSKWSESWPLDTFDELLALSEHCRACNIEFGIGLSPLELFRDYNQAGRSALIKKVALINRLNVSVLCILFDDMPGDFTGLAKQQLAIVNDVLSVSKAARHIVCPTYYSYDPVLEDVFGKMPAHYFEELGEGLPQSVGVFWTGDKVISATITVEQLTDISAKLKRKPVLWDNIIVNDGKKTADFLRLIPISGRSHNLPDALSGQLINPMNQPYLSQLALASLLPNYVQAVSFKKIVEQSLPATLSRLIARDCQLFNERGLQGLSTDDKVLKIQEYQQCRHPAAEEIIQWLKGDYCFDPDCLTG